VIGVGYNLLPESAFALAYARELAEECRASLRLFAVLESDLLFGYTGIAEPGRGDLVVSEREQLERTLASAIEELPRALRAQGQVLTGVPDEVLAAEAEKGVDVLVLGSRGYGPVRRVLLGGTSAKVMRSSPCPVIAVPRSAEQ
jgi:nucleotide-binding universal stress UspA family protein